MIPNEITIYIDCVDYDMKLNALRLSVNQSLLRKFLLLILVTVCFSNCTVFRYIYIHPWSWYGIILGALFLADFKIPTQGNIIKIYAIFLTYIVINFLLSDYKGEVQKYLLVMIAILCLFGTRFSNDELSFFVKACCWAGSFVAVTIILEYFFNDICSNYLWFFATPYPAERALVASQKAAEILYLQAYSGVAFEKADAAYYVAIALIVRFSSILVTKKKEKYTFCWIALYIIAIFLTGKRMLLLCAGVIAFLLFLISQERNKAIKILKWTGIVVVFLILFSNLPVVNHMLTRFASAFNGEDAALAERYTKWSYAMKLFEIKPLFGHGYGTYNEASALVGYAATFFAHNIYIQLLSDCGAIGTLLFLVMAAYNLWLGFDMVYYKREDVDRQELNLVYFSFAIQLLILLYGMSGNTLFYVFQLTLYLFCYILTNHVRKSYFRRKSLAVIGESEKDD